MVIRISNSTITLDERFLDLLCPDAHISKVTKLYVFARRKTILLSPENNIDEELFDVVFLDDGKITICEDALDVVNFPEDGNLSITYQRKGNYFIIRQMKSSNLP